MSDYKKQFHVELTDEITFEQERERHAMQIESLELTQEDVREQRSEQRRLEQDSAAEIKNLKPLHQRGLQPMMHWRSCVSKAVLS